MVVKHGANLFDLSEKLGIDKNNIMDFSSNINPFGASSKAKEKVIQNIDNVSIYPDPEYKSLKTSISKYCNCKDKNIVLGSGATELISLFINIINPKNALLLSPAYSEYEKELKKAHCNINKYFAKSDNEFKIGIDELKKEIKKEEYDLIIICNPNNPTGFAFNKNEIRELLKETSAFVMVDETYIEFTNTDEYSSTHLVDEFENIFVIRGTSKFFSTPGIRLGYGLISNENIKINMLNKLDLWNINIFATIMGEEMFKDNEYIKSTISHMAKEREYLFEELKKVNGIEAFQSRGNFILCKILSNSIDSKSLYEKLLKEGIIIRDCTSFEGLSNKFFRVCVLKHNENELLMKKLKEIFS